MVTKLIGYILSAVGLIVLGVSSIPKVKELIGFAIPLTDKTMIIAGVVLVVVGVTLAFSKSKGKVGKEKQASEEVPIYQGEGKHRKIVGYKRA